MKKKRKTKNGLCLGHLVTNPDSSVGGDQWKVGTVLRLGNTARPYDF